MPTIDANGLHMHYEVSGQGEPLLLIAGLASDLSSWGFQLPALVERYRVITFDNRGIGSTDSPPGPYTSRLLAEDACNLLTALGFDRVHVLGHSMGGMIAQEMALAQPDRVRTLGLCCTTGKPSRFSSRLLQAWAEMAPLVGLPRLLKEVTLWCLTPEFFNDRPEEAQELTEELARVSQSVESYLDQLHAVRAHDATSRLSALRVPTYVISAAYDRVFPPEQSWALHELISGSRLFTLERGGHDCEWEEPGLFNSVVLQALSVQSD